MFPELSGRLHIENETNTATLPSRLCTVFNSHKSMDPPVTKYLMAHVGMEGLGIVKDVRLVTNCNKDCVMTVRMYAGASTSI